MNPIALSVGLLLCSNVFMTFAWYAHLKELNGKPWIIAALVSWGVALLEYLFQVPANRIGYTVLSVDRKSTRLNSSHVKISYAVFCLKKKKPGWQTIQHRI